MPDFQTDVEIVNDFDFDPTNPPDKGFEFIGRLVFNEYTRAREEYAQAAGGRPIQWRQEFDVLDMAYDDGGAVTYSNTVNVTSARTGEPVGKNSPAHKVGLAWQSVTPSKTNMSPRDTRSRELLGHVFRMKSQTLQLGKDQKTGDAIEKRVYVPIEYLGGPDFRYTGEMRKATRKETDREPTAPAGLPQASSNGHHNDDSNAALLADILNGRTRSSAFGAVLNSPAKTIDEVFGVEVISGLDENNCAVVDMLIERGFLTEQTDGTLEKVAP